MSTKEQEVQKLSDRISTSQKSAKSSSTGRTNTKTKPPVSPAKPAPRQVKAKFKAGKDL